jgi:cyclophilin family peptidyl-prolyl cis-trans isomerase
MPSTAKEYLLNKRVFWILVIVTLTTLLVSACVPASAPAPAATSSAAGGTSASPAPTAAASGGAQTESTAAPATQGALLLPTPAQTAAPTIAPDKRQAVPAPPADGSRPLAKIPPAERADRFSGPAPMSIVTGTKYIATIVTSKGNIVAELYTDTPLSDNNFVTLAKDGFYDGLTFHRVEPSFVIQGGDPKGDGSGGPGYTIPAEIKHNHPRGALAWARTGDEVNPKRDSSGSQFYITLVDTPFLDNQYTSFGYVIEGMDVADKIAIGDKIERIDISTSDVSRLPTPTAVPTPGAPTMAEGRPLAKLPLQERSKIYNTPPTTTVVDPKKTYQATISTDKGDIVLDLDAAKASADVNNFVLLADLGFFDGTPVAYVEQGAAVILGSPAGQPDSDAGYKLPLDANAQSAQVITGTVAYYPVSNTSGDAFLASSSQFLIAMSAIKDLSAPMNVFGKVASGGDVVAKLAAGDMIKTITISEK